MKISWERQIGKRPQFCRAIPAGRIVVVFFLIFGLLTDADIGQLPATDRQALGGIVVDSAASTALRGFLSVAVARGA